MLTHEPDLRSTSPTNMADQHSSSERSTSLWGQLLLLAILMLAALMRSLR